MAGNGNNFSRHASEDILLAASQLNAHRDELLRAREISDLEAKFFTPGDSSTALINAFDCQDEALRRFRGSENILEILLEKSGLSPSVIRD